MSRILLILSIFITGLFFASANAQTEATVEIVTPVPAPKETVVVPQGYTTCFTVAASWYQGTWYPEHQVCTYDPEKVKTAEGSAWIAGYWTCTKYNTSHNPTQANCVDWKWIEGRWVKVLPVY